MSLPHREFLIKCCNKDEEINVSHDGVSGDYTKVTTITEDGMNTNIAEVIHNGITKMTTTVIDKEGKATTTVDIFGPDGKPLKNEKRRRINGRTLLTTFLINRKLIKNNVA